MHGQVWDPKKDGDGLGALLFELLSYATVVAVCGVWAQKRCSSRTECGQLVVVVASS
jgi:hypothetical protein